MTFKSYSSIAFAAGMLSLLTVTAHAQTAAQGTSGRPLRFGSKSIAPLNTKSGTPDLRSTQFKSPSLQGLAKPNLSPAMMRQNLTVARGGTSGGGGSDIVAEFIVRARNLVSRLQVTNPDVAEIKAVGALLASTNLKVLPVKNLKDIITGEEIPDQEGLLAYGNPGVVQLRTKIWNQAFLSNRNMDHHIFHELCRAAAPACNDEAYRISIVQLQLAPSSYAPASNPELAVAKTKEEVMKIAINLSDEAGMRSALAMGVKIDEEFSIVGKQRYYGSTDLMSPLSYATMIGSDRSVELLIGLGASPNKVDSFHLTAMHRAAAFNRLGIIRYLVNRGASVEPSPNFFWDDKMVVGAPNQPTPLITTIKSGSIEAARLLISLGAKLSYANSAKSEVYFPLLSAVEERRPDFVKLFVDAGADINEQGWGCWNALTCAANQGNEPMVRYLVSLGADVNHVIHDDGRDGALGYDTTALKVAETLKMAKLLVSLGANPKLTFPSGNALFEAVAKNNLELVKFFVEAGTPLNEVIDSRVVTDFSGLTALDAAISRNYPAIVAYLKSKGAKSAKK